MKFLNKINLFKFSSLFPKLKFGEITNFFDQVNTTIGRNNKKSLIKDFFKTHKNNKELLLSFTNIISDNRVKIDEGENTLITQNLVNNSEMEGLKNLNKQQLYWEDFIKNYSSLKSISGPKSNEIKSFYLSEIFSYNLRDIDIKYIKDIVLSNITIGATHNTFFDCIKELKEENLDLFDKEMMVDFERIFNRKFDKNEIELFINVECMMPKSLMSFEEFSNMLNKMKGEDVLVEDKFDGERIQLHYEKEKGIQFFSRSSENVTKKFLTLVKKLEIFFEENEIENVILDCEIVGFDFLKGEILDFNFLQNLKNENNVFEDENKNLKIYIFDCMFLNNINLINKTILLRKNLLLKSFQKYSKVIEISNFDYYSKKDPELENKLYKQFLKAKNINNEGLVIKTTHEESFYFPGKRKDWYKLKYFYCHDNDNLDLIVMGGYYGKVN